MDNTEFKKTVQIIVSKYGFIYRKKNYYFDSGKLIIVINLQKSNFDNSYYINYGFCVKDIHKELQYPKPNECDISGRFLNEVNKDVYNLDEMNSNEIVIDLEKNIHNFIVPVINEGINRYFEMFPHAICRATIKLKEYLRVN